VTGKASPFKPSLVMLGISTTTLYVDTQDYMAGLFHRRLQTFPLPLRPVFTLAHFGVRCYQESICKQASRAPSEQEL